MGTADFAELCKNARKCPRGCGLTVTTSALPDGTTVRLHCGTGRANCPGAQGSPSPRRHAGFVRPVGAV